MAFVFEDRVRDTSLVEGTGTVTLDEDVPARFRSFGSVLATGDTFPYAIVHSSANEWEVGVGKMASETTFTRDRVVSSSNSDMLVSFTAGIKDVFLTLPANFGVRESLAANRTYYVRTDGADSNSGFFDSGASGVGAFLTIQKAIDTVWNTLDLNGFDVLIQVRAGTFDGAVANGGLTGDGLVTVSGDTTTPANVIIDTSGTRGFLVTGGAVLRVQGFTFGPSTSSEIALSARGSEAGDATGLPSCIVISGNCTFASQDSDEHMVASESGCIYRNSNYTISGGAATHMRASKNGTIYTGSITVTLTGTPTFTSEFARCDDHSFIYDGATYSGSANASTKRFTVDDFSFINGVSDSLTYHPGGVAGTVANCSAYGNVLKDPLLVQSATPNVTVSSFMATVLDDTTAAAARVTLGVGYALLSQGTHSGTSLNFTGLGPGTIGTVKGFILELSEIEPATDFTSAQMQLGDSGGLDSGVADYALAYLQNTAADDVIDSSDFTFSSIILTDFIGNAAGESGACTVRIGTNATAPATHNLVKSDFWDTDGDAVLRFGWWIGRRVVNIDLDRFSIAMDDASSFTCNYRLMAIE